MTIVPDENTILELEHYWPYQAAVLADLVGRHTVQLLHRHGGMNLSQWRVLAAVGEKPGRPAKDVVDITPMDKGIVSRAVRALIDQKLLRREVSKQDRRLTHLYLTDTGTTEYRKIAKALTDEVSNATRDIGLDKELLALIAKYSAAMRGKS